MRFGINPLALTLFELVTLVNQQRHIAAIVDDKLRTLAACMAQRLIGTPPVLFERLALPGEHRNARRSDCRRRVVLRGEDVAARPAHGCAELHERLDQHGCLDCHVQRAGNAHALQRLGRGVLAPDRHQARHFLLGDSDFLAAPVGEADVRYFVLGLLQCCSRHFVSYVKPS